MSAVLPVVAEAARQRWPERGPAWLDAVPVEMDALCRDLGLTPTGRTFPARFAHVVETTTRAGARLVLRSSPDPDAVHQVDVLDRLARLHLAPALLSVQHTATATWTVTEAVAPGTPLAADDIGASECAAISTALRKLSHEEAGPVSVPPIVPWLRARLVTPPAADQPPHRGVAPDAVRRAATAVLDELASETTDGLCHGDLSPSNLLRGTSRLWLIDPRGVNGEAAYDVAVIALKARRDDIRPAQNLARSLALDSTIDPERAAAWVTVANAATV